MKRLNIFFRFWQYLDTIDIRGRKITIIDSDTGEILTQQKNGFEFRGFETNASLNGEGKNRSVGYARTAGSGTITLLKKWLQAIEQQNGDGKTKVDTRFIVSEDGQNRIIVITKPTEAN